MEMWSVYGEVLLRLFVAVFLGGLLGFERTIAHKVAGIRTYALVSLGAALFVTISDLVSMMYANVPNFQFDPLRVASQVVVGIGFLGAGLIIFRGSKVSGLTTAAGLWVAAGVGLAVGYQLYLLAVAATLLTLFVFVVLWFVEDQIR